MNRRLRIVQWAIPYFPVIGGREVFTRRLSHELVSRGHSVEVFAQPALKESELDSNLSIYRIPVREIFTQDRGDETFEVSAALRGRLADLDPDVIHIQTIGPEVMLLAQALRFNGQDPKLVYTNHDLALDSTGPAFAFSKYVANKVDAITAVSGESYSALTRNLPDLKDKIVLIRNGVPIPLEPRVPAPMTGFIFAFGRISSEKGFEILIRAWRKTEVTDRKLVISGDGPQLHYLRELTKSLGCESSVIFTGWLHEHELGEQLDRCAFVVVPSIFDEPFGLVAAEAQARGRAVIASVAGALPEIVVDSETGYLVPVGDIQLLTEKMSSLITDPTQARLFGEAGRSRMAQLFNFDTCVDQYEALYQRLIAG